MELTQQRRQHAPVAQQVGLSHQAVFPLEIEALQRAAANLGDRVHWRVQGVGGGAWVLQGCASMRAAESAARAHGNSMAQLPAGYVHAAGSVNSRSFSAIRSMAAAGCQRWCSRSTSPSGSVRRCAATAAACAATAARSVQPHSRYRRCRGHGRYCSVLCGAAQRRASTGVGTQQRAPRPARCSAALPPPPPLGTRRPRARMYGNCHALLLPSAVAKRVQDRGLDWADFEHGLPWRDPAETGTHVLSRSD